MILKCPLNNFFWLTPYIEKDTLVLELTDFKQIRDMPKLCCCGFIASVVTGREEGKETCKEKDPKKFCTIVHLMRAESSVSLTHAKFRPQITNRPKVSTMHNG